MQLAVTVPEVVSFALSAAFCAWYCLEKHWLANNTLGLAFSIQGVEYISVGKLATGMFRSHCRGPSLSSQLGICSPQRPWCVPSVSSPHGAQDPAGMCARHGRTCQLHELIMTDGQILGHSTARSRRAGGLLLCGLFFYDIFWVFGTPVMVSVAKSLDAPIKLLFPRPYAAAGELLRDGLCVAASHATACRSAHDCLGDCVQDHVFMQT